MRFCLFGLAVTVILSACAPPQAPPPAVPKVTVSHPHMATVTNWDEYPGHIQAVESVEIRPRVSGYLESIHFTDGAEVKAGDLLFVIDPRPYQAELDRARAERQRAETRLELASNDLRRAEILRGTKALAEEDFDTRQKAAREADAALAAAKAAEAMAQINVDFTRIKAPINGRIGRRIVTVGNLVQGGGMVPGTVMAALVSVDPVYCYFDADERSFQRYRTRGGPGANGGSTEAAPASLACELGLVNDEGFPHAGRIDFFDNQVNEKTGTIRVRGIFANPDRSLIPGMFARVRVSAGPPASTLLIPAVAIGSDQGQKFVLLVNKEGLIESQPIQVGRQHGTLRAVLEGLTVNDRVVVNGLMTARPGSKVEVVEGEPPGSGPAPEARR